MVKKPYTYYFSPSIISSSPNYVFAEHSFYKGVRIYAIRFELKINSPFMYIAFVHNLDGHPFHLTARTIKELKSSISYFLSTEVYHA